MIRNYNLIRAIVSEPWLIAPEEVEKLGFLLSGVFDPAFSFVPLTKEERAQSEIHSMGSGKSGEAYNVGVIQMTGPLIKYDTLCADGMETYGQMIQRLASNPKISSIVLCIDSPGGTVSGTENLATIIKGAKKPVIAYVSDLACSAAYWLACQCDEIIANNTTASVGSIGVRCTYADFSEQFAQQGIKIHDIVPVQSAEKIVEEQQIKAGKYEMTQARLGVIADKFHEVVKAARPNVRADQLTGKVYFAKDVIGTLIDSIGTFDQALARAAELAATKTNNQDHNTMSKPKFSVLAQAAGVESLESADGTITLTAEMVASVEKALSDSAVSTSALSTLQDQLTAMDTQMKAVNQSLTEATNKIAELEKKPGAEGASVSPATDGTSAGPTPAEDFPSACIIAQTYSDLING